MDGHALKYPRIVVRKLLSKPIYRARCHPGPNEQVADVFFKTPGAAVMRAERLARAILRLTDHAEVVVEDRTGIAEKPVQVFTKTEADKQAAQHRLNERNLNRGVVA